jgi:hypothetical protein
MIERSFQQWRPSNIYVFPILLPGGLAITWFIAIVLVSRPQPPSLLESPGQILQDDLRPFIGRSFQLGTGFYITLLGIALCPVALRVAALRGSRRNPNLNFLSTWCRCPEHPSSYVTRPHSFPAWRWLPDLLEGLVVAACAVLLFRPGGQARPNASVLFAHLFPLWLAPEFLLQKLG